MDCSKSAELYEQSSEQLLEEERRRAESRKSKLDYQQSIDGGGQQDYYDVQNLSYDGKQNGRIKTYEEPPLENQVQSNQERIKTSRFFDSGSNYQESNAQRDNQFHGTNGFSSPTPGTRQFNQFTRNTDEGNAKYPTTPDYYGTPKKAQNYHASNRNLNSQRDEKGALKRQKFKSSARNNSTTTVSQRVTPAYTESTTFRASSTTPVKESQQFAESAAFVSNRGNRFNQNAGNTHQYYYQLYLNRDTTKNPDYESTTAIYRADSTQRNDFSSFRSTTVTPFDATTQYATTLAPPCNDDVTTESGFVTYPSTNPDVLPTTASNYDYRGNVRSTVDARNTFPTTNYYNSFEDRSTRVTDSSVTGALPTTRAYVTTDNYRQNSITPNSVQKYGTSQVTYPPTSTVRSSFGRGTESPTTRSIFDSQYNRGVSKNPSTVSPGYRQNFISSTTEKPSRTTPALQQNTVTEKDLSPYDRSFTYKQGKVMSTLGPYIPFTRNYAYTTSTPTSKATQYSPTVPTYTTAKTLIPKLKPSPTVASKIKSSARFSEKEHAISMLNSLRNLEDNASNLDRAINPSGPPAPSTLHSLALYFSTATENFDSNQTTESPINVESEEDVEKSVISKKSNGTQVPSGLLTQHTLNSYAELFKLNDAAENNVTTEDRLDDSSVYSDDYTEDLELQQSGGSLDDLRRSNSTRLRELAQVFTHALSAYLLDPDTFKKVLTEIRPTEPSTTTTEDDQWRTTTIYPILNEDFTSAIREKDEVLDFSDDGNELRQKLTTTYPTTFDPPVTTIQDAYETLSTLPSTYYTTPRPSQGSYEFSTTPMTSAYFETSVPPTESSFVPSSTPYGSDSSVFYGQNNEVDKSSIGSPVTDNYISSGATGNTKKVGGFQNNSVTTVTEPYDQKFFVTTPLSDNYIVSPTPPPSQVHMVAYNWNKKLTSKKPEQQLTPPFFETHAETVRRESERSPQSLNPEHYPSTPMTVQSVRSTTFGSTKSYETSTSQPFRAHHHKSLLSEPKSVAIAHPTSRTSYMKFRNLYNRVDEVLRSTGSTERSVTPRTTESVTASNSVETTPCSHGDPTESFESGKEDQKVLTNDHWTSSPAVTRLWETSVFVDPQHINHGLESDPSSTISIDSVTDSRESLEFGSTPSVSGGTTGAREEALAISESDSSALQPRQSRDKDSPTTFSLLPTAFSNENTVTPKPLITTRSSITTTITSSITSTNTLPQDGLVSSLLPYTITASGSNETENEIAEMLFGKLNASSSSTLMRVMKQADNNETVRQLVLLLVRHCKDPVNKTMQREKEELLNALLRLPVSEFASEESKTAVAGIHQISLPATRSIGYATNTPTTPLVTEPPITTFRSRKSRKFRTTTENSANVVRRSEKRVTSDGSNSLQEDESSASDSRALELLRSLYTIATKWG